jgi:MFS family permease
VSNGVQTGIIRTKIPARLDRLPWSRFHWVLVIGLGTAPPPCFSLPQRAPAAYLTVSEIFPIEARALCIAVFYAIGTGIGGVIGPQVFSRMINTGSYDQVFLAFGLGAVMMILGGLAETALGVKAERESLERVARPLAVA